jgi:hypothetical protein
MIIQIKRPGQNKSFTVKDECFTLPAQEIYGDFCGRKGIGEIPECESTRKLTSRPRKAKYISEAVLFVFYFMQNTIVPASLFLFSFEEMTIQLLYGTLKRNYSVKQPLEILYRIFH